MNSRLVALVGAVVFAPAAFAWSWSGKTGDIVVDENATVTDADIPVVSALTGIHINDGVKLSFSNTSRLVLSAVLTGDGETYVGDGCAVTFAGNSPTYTGEMHFFNSKIYVTHSYALGSGKKKDGSTQRYVYSDGSYHSTARPNAEGLCFADGVACQPGIYWYGDRDSQKKNGVNVTWFSSNMTDRVTFNGPLVMNKNGNVDYVRLGNYTLNGLWTRNLGTPGIKVNGGCTAYINGGIDMTGLGSGGYCHTTVEKGAELHLGKKIAYYPNSGDFYGLGRVVCDQVDVLPSKGNFPLGYKNGYTGCSGTLDLNGKDQSAENVGIHDWDDKTSHYDWDPVRGDPVYVEIRSDASATLSITGTYNWVNAEKKVFPAKFSGQVSLRKTAPGTYTLVNQFSDTTGKLTVTGGGKVKFDWQAGWNGDVEAFGAGSGLIFADGASLNSDGKSNIILADGATLELSNNVGLVCRAFKIDGESLPTGSYSPMTPATAGVILGEGSVQVLGATSVWKGGGTGWSDPANWEGGEVPPAGGAIKIPEGKTAVVAEGDRTLVSGLGSINLIGGSRLELKHTGALALSALLTGSGSLVADAAGPITLSGANAGFTGPMAFTNTTVVVASRTALGSTLRSIVHWTDDTAAATALLFRGNGLTNDVPVQFSGSRHEAGRYFTDSFTDPWVQNGRLEYLSPTRNLTLRLGNCTLNAGFKAETTFANYKIWIEVQTGCTCDLGSTGGGSFNLTLFRGRLIALDGATVKLAQTSAWNEFFALTGNGRFVSSGSGSIASGRTACLGDPDSYTTIDMNGKDITVGSLLYNQTEAGTEATAPLATDEGFATLTSETPALVTLAYGNGRSTVTRYSGKVSLTRVAATATGTYTLMNQYSDTTGTLTVGNGTVAFDDGAGWGGDIAVTGGTVSFLKRCPRNSSASAYGNATVSGSGKINVAAGARYNCKTLTAGGTPVPEGIYSIAQLQQLCGNSFFSGEGFIRVGNKSGFALFFR